MLIIEWTNEHIKYELHLQNIIVLHVIVRAPLACICES